MSFSPTELFLIFLGTAVLLFFLGWVILPAVSRVFVRLFSAEQHRDRRITGGVEQRLDEIQIQDRLNRIPVTGGRGK